jgi:CRP-like cAMP-binding protein
MIRLPIQGAQRQEVLAALSESPWFRALERRAAASEEGRRQLDHLIGSADLVRYAAGETIVEQNYPSDSFHVIVRGSVRVTAGEGEARRDLGGLTRPASFGEIGLLLDEPRGATVAAEKEVLALAFGAEAFQRVFAKIPEFGLDTARHLARRLKDLTAFVPAPKAKPKAPRRRRTRASR